MNFSDWPLAELWDVKTSSNRKRNPSEQYRSNRVGNSSVQHFIHQDEEPHHAAYHIQRCEEPKPAVSHPKGAIFFSDLQLDSIKNVRTCRRVGSGRQTIPNFYFELITKVECKTTVLCLISWFDVELSETKNWTHFSRLEFMGRWILCSNRWLPILCSIFDMLTFLNVSNRSFNICLIKFQTILLCCIFNWLWMVHETFLPFLWYIGI